MAIDTKKEQERDELHRAIWAIADELRGAVDGWDFKNYVLGTMFYRYISENLTNYVNESEIEAGTPDFDYAALTDEEAAEAKDGLIEAKGFFILPSELFCNVQKRAASDSKWAEEHLNEVLDKIFRDIEGSANPKGFTKRLSVSKEGLRSPRSKSLMCVSDTLEIRDSLYTLKFFAVRAFFSRSAMSIRLISSLYLL